jgi:hypothetical protein
MIQPPLNDMPDRRKHVGTGAPAGPCPRTAAVLACALAFTNIAASAAAGPYPYNPDRLDQTQLGQIGRACQAVVGVQPPESRYFACVGSLSDSARNVGRGRALHQAENDCLRKGLRTGSPDLDVCVVQSAREGGAPPPELAMSRPMEEPGLSKSYPYASQREVHRREELSCARLGLDPAGGAFASCVGGLDSALDQSDNPSQ